MGTTNLRAPDLSEFGILHLPPILNQGKEDPDFQWQHSLLFQLVMLMSRPGSEGISINILVLSHVVDVKLLKLVSQLDRHLILSYESFVFNFILAYYLVDDEF